MTQRNDTLRDHEERLNRVLRFIEDNLDDALTLDRLSGVACFSPFHFHRIFAAHVRETVSGYVRRLRLERAANRLCRTSDPVTDIALDAGYETHGAFTKAFHQHFGVSPTHFRKSRDTGLFPQPRLLVSLKSKETAMTPEMRNTDDMRVAYVRRTGRYDRAAQEAWQTLCALAGPRGWFGPDARCIGIGYDDPSTTPEEKLRYDACITVGPQIEGEGDVGIQTIRGGRYAVFLHKGPYNGLAATYGEIFGRWLPEGGATLRDEPSFELYLNDCTRTPPEKLLTEIWVPVQ